MSRLYRPEHPVLLALALALALVGGACVRPGPPDVAIRPVQASLVFGVKPPADVVQPPAQESLLHVSSAPPSLGDLSFELPPPFAPFVPPAEPQSDCEPAPPSAAAKVPVEVNVNGGVPVGVYRWRIEGSVTPAGGQPTAIRRRFESRIIRNLRVVSPHEHRFESVQQVAGSDLVAVSTFKVRTNATSRNVDPGYNYIVTLPAVGEPDRGVVLERVDYKDSTGNTRRSFAPATGLLLLPLPVVSGESYKSVAVDPKTGQTIVHEAQVLRRGRIDACGELADGWYVTATQTVTGGDGGAPTKVAYEYVVGTQFGGMLLNERVKSTDANGGVAELDYTIGQLSPDPLPAGA